jgi:hypothetical protein
METEKLLRDILRRLEKVEVKLAVLVPEKPKQRLEGFQLLDSLPNVIEPMEWSN